MSFVTMNAIKVPEDRREQFEKRFAARAAQVDNQEGFEAFELLRPVEGSDRYLVYTRWASRDAFNAWVGSPAFMEGHKFHREEGPISTDSELWMFELIQSEYASR